MKVYISGPISGRPLEEAKREFAEAAERLRGLGHEPVNPFDSGLPAEAPWTRHMAADLAMLLDCEGIYMLPLWTRSRGARIEAAVAYELRLEVIQ
jgi:hypothetical protein